MGLNEYRVGRLISFKVYPFYALIQAAMRQSDTDNLEKLKQAWPEVWDELLARSKVPEGLLPGE